MSSLGSILEGLNVKLQEVLEAEKIKKEKEAAVFADLRAKELEEKQRKQREALKEKSTSGGDGSGGGGKGLSPVSNVSPSPSSRR